MKHCKGLKLRNLFLCSMLLVINIADVSAHAEHDKARYVSPTGTDKGRCDDAHAPCRTIAYAATHANKGDHIRLSSGSYSLKDDNSLFYLLSNTIPVKPNFSVRDHFAKAETHSITRLVGVPPQYAKQLADKGFSVIVDRKGIKSSQNNKLARQLSMYAEMQKSQSETPCENGTAGSNACSQLDLLSHMALGDFSSSPGAANDIWGHYDLNDGREYAIIGLRNGVAIVDVTDPVSPREVTTVGGQATIWRDIKVYQYFDAYKGRWQSYAYVTADSASVGLMIIDLSGLPDSAELVGTDKTDVSAHNVYLSNVDYSTGVPLAGKSAYLHIAGSNNKGGAFNSYSLANPELLSSVYTNPENDRSNYSHDVASMIITDIRKDTQCVNGTSFCEVFFDFNENNFQLWDKTKNNDPQRLSTTSYANASYVHSGWSTEDNNYVLVHDELDEENLGLNTTVRIFDISDLTRPTMVGIFTGPTAAIDHNGFVHGNRYYMSNYERGLTVLDISDPKNPQQAGFFDTYPISDNAAFNGAWGVYPYLPSGHILVSDINSGLYVLRDKTTVSANGSFHFTNEEFPATEGNTAVINVARTGNASAAVSVNWTVSTGSAGSEDMVIGSGTLNWADGEIADKSITIDITDDGEGEDEEMFFVRLSNPQNGATLSSPSLAKVVIAASSGNRTPTVDAGNDQNVETGATVTLTATGNDADGDSLTYSWLQTGGATVTINDANTANASFLASNAGTYSFEVTVTDPMGKSASDTTQITVVSKVVTNPPQSSSSGGGSTGYPGLLVILAGLMRRRHLRARNDC